jgi:putative acetyltransferase
MNKQMSIENLQISPIKNTDNPVLATIIRQAFHDFNAPTFGTVYEDPTTDDLFTLFQKVGAICWVAELENEIVGCCGIYPTPHLPEGCVELVKFYLSSSARGRGIGRQLMVQCLQSALDMGYKKGYIESLPQFAIAVSMYEKLGFRKINHPLGKSGHTGCKIWMVKDL